MRTLFLNILHRTGQAAGIASRLTGSARAASTAPNSGEAAAATQSAAHKKLYEIHEDLSSRRIQPHDINLSFQYHYNPGTSSFAVEFKPDSTAEAEKKIDALISKYHKLVIKKQGKEQAEEPNIIALKKGAFFKPVSSASSGNTIVPACSEDVSKATVLLGCPIYVSAKDSAGMTSVINKYCKLFDVRDYDSLQDMSEGGVVIYAATHSRLTEELRTLVYLKRASKPKPIPPFSLGYREVYESFIKPKLFQDGQLVAPEAFSVKFATASYSNRIFDICMGMLASELRERSVDPYEYLRQCYGISLIANPYNFTPVWNDASDWRKDVIKHVSSDVVWGFTDLATRVMPEQDLFLAQFGSRDNNRIVVKDTTRQSIIITPDIKTTFKGLTAAETWPAILGHDLKTAIDALCEQEEHFVSNLRLFMAGKIKKSEFEKLRLNKTHQYNYDPNEGIPIGDISNIPPLSCINMGKIGVLHAEMLAIARSLPVQNPKISQQSVLYDIYNEHETYSNPSIRDSFGNKKLAMLKADLIPGGRMRYISTLFIYKFTKELSETISDESRRHLLLPFFDQLVNEKTLLDESAEGKSLGDFLEDLEQFPFVDALATLSDSSDKQTEAQVIDKLLRSHAHYNDEFYGKYRHRPWLFYRPYINLPDYIYYPEHAKSARQKIPVPILTEEELAEDEARRELYESAELKSIDWFDNKLASKIQITPELECYKYTLFAFMYEATKNLLKQTKIDDLYAVMLYKEFMFSTCLKLRATNASFDAYVNEYYENCSEEKPKQLIDRNDDIASALATVRYWYYPEVSKSIENDDGKIYDILSQGQGSNRDENIKNPLATYFWDPKYTGPDINVEFSTGDDPEKPKTKPNV